MFSVEITNFKSLKNIKFEFEGMATIVGRNFVGKSNIIQAINAALTNQSGSDFITWGEYFCEVRIKTTGLDLLWHKEKSNNFYTINGVTDKKIGKDGIPKILKDLGYGIVRLSDDSKINLMYSKQFDELFLVDRNDSKTLDLLTAVYGLDRLYKAIELCNKEQTSNAGLFRIRKKDIEILEKDLERFKNFDKTLNKRDLLKKEKSILEKDSNEVDNLKALFTSVVSTHIAVKKLKGIENILIPDIKEISKAIEEQKELRRLFGGYSLYLGQTEVLKPVLKIKVPEEDEAIDSSIKELDKIKSLNTALIKANSEYKKLAPIINVIIPSVPDIDVNEVSNLKKLYDDAIDIKKQIKNISISIEDLVTEHNIIQKTIDEEFKGMCPLCGNAIGNNHENH